MKRAARKVVCTIAAGPHREFLDITRPHLAAFADRHGYDLVVLDRVLAPQRAASWSKVPLVHDLADRYDLVLWIDSDAVIVDDRVDVADELSSRAFLHLVEHRTTAGRIPNCGVMVARGGAVTRSFLERVWRRGKYTQHEWWENAAVLDLLGYQIQRPVRPVRPSVWLLGTAWIDRSWNSIPADPSPSPRIAHFPGMTVPQRMDAMRAAVDAAACAPIPT